MSETFCVIQRGYHSHGQVHIVVKDEIEKVINGESGKVAIGGRLHPRSGQNSHADGVSKDTKGDE